MKKRLFIYPTLMLFFGLLSFFTISVHIAQNNNLNIAKKMSKEITEVYADFFAERQDMSYFIRLSRDTQINVLNSDGSFLAGDLPIDNTTREGRLARPEIIAALSGFPVADVRYCYEFGISFVYYSLRVDTADGYVFIHTATPAAGVDAYAFQAFPLLIFLTFIGAVICLLLSRRLVKRITKPFEFIEQKLHSLLLGEYEQSRVGDSYDEIAPVIRKIDDAVLLLQNNFITLENEKFKLEYILNNIGDGIFVVDENKNIMLINDAALSSFDAVPDVSGKSLHYLSFDESLAKAIEDCINHERSALLELHIKGRIFFAAIKRLPGTTMTMAALSDVTESRENARRREEFFANASHELKTPLTAIKGFNELMAINNKDDSVRKYIDSTARETERMLTLIGDMLKLSELESMPDTSTVPVSLKKIVNEVYETLSVAIGEKLIRFETTGDAVIDANHAHIYELVKNLMENAVRYNNQGGEVSVKIEKSKRFTRLLVSDNGIGISPEEQTRIFERFYRVEKSRSGRGGGTGLGLSIVKHICALYGWNLSLKSKLGVGTEMIVAFGNCR